MNTILENIIADKRQEVENAKKITPIEILIEETRNYTRPAISMVEALKNSDTGIISEFKRSSPSKGLINPDIDCATVIAGYVASGATACSILIDNNYFSGSLDDLKIARAVAPQTPLLFKEFVIDPYQIYQARLAGADAVLLIAACLNKKLAGELSSLINELGMEVLFEVHNCRELDLVNNNIDILGVNNRDLETFKTDVTTSFTFGESLKTTMSSLLFISESGISDIETINDLRELGFKGFLMGTKFMLAENPANELKDFISKLKNN